MWFGICTKPQKEFACANWLRDLGMTIFVPVEYKWRRANSVSRRRRKCPYPLLVRYIFCNVDTRYDLEPLADCRLVSSIVGTGGRPRAITKKSMERLFTLSQASEAIPSQLNGYNPHKAIKAGDEAEVVTGPFAGWRFRVEAVHGKRARALLQFFNSSQEVLIPLEYLEAG